MEVSADVVALLPHAAQLDERLHHEPWTQAVVAVRHAVFRDVEGNTERRPGFDGLAYDLGVGLAVGRDVSVVALRDVRRNVQAAGTGLSSEECVTERGADVQAVVKVEADEVGLSRRLRNRGSHHGKG